MKSSPKRRKIQYAAAAILNNGQHQGRSFVSSFCPRDFDRVSRLAFSVISTLVMITLEPCYFEANALQTPKMITVKIAKWIIGWKK